MLRVSVPTQGLMQGSDPCVRQGYCPGSSVTMFSCQSGQDGKKYRTAICNLHIRATLPFQPLLFCFLVVIGTHFCRHCLQILGILATQSVFVVLFPHIVAFGTTRLQNPRILQEVPTPLENLIFSSMVNSSGVHNHS